VRKYHCFIKDDAIEKSIPAQCVIDNKITTVPTKVHRICDDIFYRALLKELQEIIDELPNWEYSINSKEADLATMLKRKNITFGDAQDMFGEENVTCVQPAVIIPSCKRNVLAQLKFDTSDSLPHAGSKPRVAPSNVSHIKDSH
jgi:hypothetical protein